MRYSEIINTGMKALDDAGIDKRWLNIGAETQSQNRLNRAYMDALTLDMRLFGSEEADTRTTLFGVDLPAPIMPAAMTGGRIFMKLIQSAEWRDRIGAPFATYGMEFITELILGVQNANSLMWLGCGAEVDYPDLPRWIKNGANIILIVKPMDDKDKILRTLQWAEEIGCIAVGMDVDAMFKHKSYDDIAYPYYYVPQSINDMKRYTAATDLPFIAKGVLSVHDAKIAKKIGIDAIVVSNHGGEALDYSEPILKALPKIREAVGEDMCIIADSGFQRGTDVLKALALGADGVGFATLLVIAFAADGGNGVTAMLRVLYEELQRAMTLTGCKRIDDIDSSIVGVP
jgi:isopentenyl diphosphate isomerase/L-lactate dehydrogenase-like FMN-dependent dehydrogenase